MSIYSLYFCKLPPNPPLDTAVHSLATASYVSQHFSLAHLLSNLIIYDFHCMVVYYHLTISVSTKKPPVNVRAPEKGQSFHCGILQIRRIMLVHPS